jgi:hypothetical protein
MKAFAVTLETAAVTGTPALAEEAERAIGTDGCDAVVA